MLRDNTVKDLPGHGVEVFDLHLTLLLLQILSFRYLTDKGFTEVGSAVEEFLEGSLEVLLPEESDVCVLIEVVRSCMLNLIKIVGDALDGAK